MTEPKLAAGWIEVPRLDGAHHSSALVYLAGVGAFFPDEWSDISQTHTWSVVSTTGVVLFTTTASGAQYMMAKRAELDGAEAPPWPGKPI